MSMTEAVLAKHLERLQLPYFVLFEDQGVLFAAHFLK